MIIKTDAIILRQTKLNNDKKILTLFTNNLGKVSAITKGINRKNAVYIQTFSYCEFILYKGKNSIYQINQVDLKHNFFNISKDIDKFYLGTYILELTEKIIAEGQNNKKLFQLLVDFLHLLENRKKEYLSLSIIYELKAMSYIGFLPELNICVNCGKQFSNTKFSVKEGGLLCNNCFSIDKNSFDISESMINVMKYIIKNDIKIFNKLTINDNILKELDIIIKEYIKNHIKYDGFKTLNFTKI